MDADRRTEGGQRSISWPPVGQGRDMGGLFLVDTEHWILTIQRRTLYCTTKNYNVQNSSAESIKVRPVQQTAIMFTKVQRKISLGLGLFTTGVYKVQKSSA